MHICSVAISTVYRAGASARGLVTELIAWVTAVHTVHTDQLTQRHTPNYSSNPPGLYM